MNRLIHPLKALLVGIPLLFLAAANTHAVLIDFTTSEGYANGPLHLQPGTTGTWRTSGSSTYYQVNTGDGGSVAVTTSVNGPLAGYFDPVDFSLGGMITTSVDFQFAQGTAIISPGGATNAFGLAYATGQTSGASSSAAASLGRQVGTDFYRLTAFGNATNVTGANLGINSAGPDLLSDVIRMTLTLSYASGSSTWSGVATLVNVNTGATVATITRNNFAIAGLSPSSLYGAMQVGNGMAGSGLTSLSVLNYTTPVPEPGTAALAGLGLGALWLFRRRMARPRRQN